MKKILFLLCTCSTLSVLAVLDRGDRPVAQVTPTDYQPVDFSRLSPAEQEQMHSDLQRLVRSQEPGDDPGVAYL